MSRIVHSFSRAATARGWVAAALLLGSAAGAQAASLVLRDVVMTGLANPRGLAVGPDGSLYVAEAGSGGSGPSIISGNEEEVFLGQTGAITRSRDSVQETVIAGLPSLAPVGGSGATGVHDLAFSAEGTLHAVLGFGADPTLRDTLPEAASLLGTAVSIEGGAATPLADLAAYERTQDPDADELNSNPYGIVALAGGGFAISDAGGNDILSVDPAGGIATLAVLAPAANTLPFGPPFYQAVPTGIAVSGNGAILVGELTGFPFPVGEADVLALEGSVLSSIASGFTNLIDVAVGADGVVYALELDSDSLIGPDTTGSLFAVGPGGQTTPLYRDLSAPTALAVGPGGVIYVAENGLSPVDGRVIALAPVPLPAALPLLAVAIAGLIGLRRTREPRA